jgi:hypothetical protein
METRTAEKRKPVTDPHAPYTLFKSDVSYFSGKMEAYLRYKGIPRQSYGSEIHHLNSLFLILTAAGSIPVMGQGYCEELAPFKLCQTMV